MLTLAHAIHSRTASDSEQLHSPDAAAKVPKAGAIIASMSAAIALYCAACTGNTRSLYEQEAAVMCKHLDLSIIDLLKDHCTFRVVEVPSDGLIFEVSSPLHGKIGELTVRSNRVHVFTPEGSKSGIVVTTPEQVAEHIRIVLEKLTDEPSSTLVTDVDTVIS